MKKCFFLLLLILFFVVPLMAEGAEPPELSGPNKKIEKISDQEKELIMELQKVLETLGDGKNQEKNKKAIDEINKMVEANPQYAQAYNVRAMICLYFAQDKDYKRIVDDITKAISLPHSKLDQEFFKTSASAYSVRAKAYKEVGNNEKAIRDLETAINLDPRDAIDVSGVNPDDVAPSGAWGKKDFDEIIKKYPSDYRGYLFRGLYYRNLGILLKPQDYKSAMNDFSKAISLNPNSAMAHYLLGTLIFQKVSLFGGGKSKEDLQKEGRAFASGQSILSVYPEERKKILNAFTKAIQLNPKMIDAYRDRAEVFFETKEFKLAIKDYDNVIKLDPDYGGAYHDRGMANQNLNNYDEAIEDFSKAIDAKKSISAPYMAYQNRANVYVRLGNYQAAIDDYSKAIKSQLENLVLLMHMAQFRGVYPEYDNISDDDLAKKLHAKFYSNLKYEDFVENFKKTEKGYSSSIVAELYEGRGDAYLNVGNYRKAVADYNRIGKIQLYYVDNMDKWKPIHSYIDNKQFINTKRVHVQEDKVSFWLKSEYSRPKKKATKFLASTIDNVEIDCSEQKLRIIAEVQYDSKGRVLNNWENSYSDWERVIPDTVGESWYESWCRE